MENKTVKKRIQRLKPNKKWTEEEIKKILEFIQEAPQTEAPTAQIFYKKLIERSGINATWELIRWKVRHLKASFKKANDWRQSTGAGLLGTDAGISSVEGNVLQMCPYYKQLNEIFGEKNLNGDFVVIDSGDMIEMDDSINESMMESSLFIDTIECDYGAEEEVRISPPASLCDAEKYLATQPSVDLTQSASTNVSKKAKDFADKLKKMLLNHQLLTLLPFKRRELKCLKLK